MTCVATASDTKKLKRLSEQAKIAYETLQEFTNDELLQISCSGHFLPECRNEVTLAKIFLKIRKTLERNKREEELRRIKLKWQRVIASIIQFRLTWQTATSWIGLIVFVAVCAKAFTEREPLLIYAQIVNSFSDSPVNIAPTVIAVIGLALMMYKASSCLCLDGQDSTPIDSQESLEELEKSEKYLRKKANNDQSLDKLVSEFDKAYSCLRDKISCRIQKKKQEVSRSLVESDDTSSDSRSHDQAKKLQSSSNSPSKKRQ